MNGVQYIIIISLRDPIHVLLSLKLQNKQMFSKNNRRESYSWNEYRDLQKTDGKIIQSFLVEIICLYMI
jgi:hypothetical protein